MGNFYLAEKDFPVWDYFAIWLLDHYFYCNTYSRYMEAFPWEVLFGTWPRHHFIIGMLSTHSLLPILCMLVHRIIYSVQEHLKTKQYWVSWQHANNHTLLTYSRPVTKQTKFLLVRSSLVHVSWVGKHLLTKHGLATMLPSNSTNDRNLRWSCFWWAGFEANWRPSWKDHPKSDVCKQIILQGFRNVFRMQPICSLKCKYY